MPPSPLSPRRRAAKGSATAGKGKPQRRPRISVSLEEGEYQWVLSQRSGEESESSTVSRLLKAAREAGIELNDVAGTTSTNKGTLEGLANWLGKRRKDKLASTFAKLLTEYLRDA